MFAQPMPRKPAPLLAWRGVMGRTERRVNAFGNALGESVAGAMTTRTLSAEGMQKPVLQSERIAPLGPMDFGPELQRVPEFAPPPSAAELQADFRASEREYRMATDTGAVNLPISGSASESRASLAAVAGRLYRGSYSKADRSRDPNYQLALAAQSDSVAKAPLTGELRADPGYWNAMHNVLGSQLPIGNKLSMAWDSTKFYFRGSDGAQGSAQALGGAFEILGGAGLTGTGGGAVLGIPLAFHGGDNIGSGLSRAFGLGDGKTVTYQGAYGLTGSERWAEAIDQGIPFLGAVGSAGAVMNKLTAPMAQRIADRDLFFAMSNGPASGPVKFGQIGISPEFSSQGAFKGALVEDVAQLIRTGALDPSDIQVNAVRWDGEFVAVNNRSLTALSLAGRQPSNVVDVTQSMSLALDNPDNMYAMVQRMREIGFKPSPTIGVRPPGSHWQTPPVSVVRISGGN